MAVEKALRPLHLFGAAWGLGATNPGCADGPDALRALRAEEVLAKRGVAAQWDTVIRPAGKNTRSTVEQVAELCQTLADNVEKLVPNRERFCVIGGDHTCAIGTWGGAAKALYSRGPLGLIWIDAHMDAHTPDTSQSGALHGMPVATLLGYGEDELRHVAMPQPKLKPEHLCVVGVRSFESGEQALLRRLGVRVVHMDEVRARGLDDVLQEAKGIVTTGTDGFGISLDLDAIDPADAPGVGTPAADGLKGAEIVDALARLAQTPDFLGAEITELNPHRDIDERTVRLAIELMYTLFK